MSEPGLTPLPSSCSWPVAWGSCADCGIPDDEKAAYEQTASELLSAWTGGIFGMCPETVRPCRARCAGDGSTFWGSGPYPGSGAGGWTPVLVGGQWYNISCGTCRRDACVCDTSASIALPGPVNGPVIVTIDGQAINPTTYRVDNLRYLVRTDGQVWPDCQDISANLDKPGSWGISYLRGNPVPLGGQVAAARLACELWKSACGDASCALPKRVTSISRQGVTIALLDSFDDVEKGRTGIWTIDSWVASVTRVVPRGGQVFSVDRPRVPVRRQTWP